MLIQIKRQGDIFLIKEITREQAQKQLGNISKYNFIINTDKPNYNLIKDLITIPFEGKNKKLISIINSLYKEFESKYPQYVKSFSIPLYISNEPYSLCITRDYIKVVNTNEQKSSIGRVHIDNFTNRQFFNDIGSSILYRQDRPNLYNVWLEKAKIIYEQQITKYLGQNKEYK